MTACEPWVEIAEKLKAMKGDVVKRQVGVGTKKNPVPTGVLNKEIEEELEKIGKGFAKELEEKGQNIFKAFLIKLSCNCRAHHSIMTSYKYFIVFL